MFLYSAMGLYFVGRGGGGGVGIMPIKRFQIVK
jgi:hypothetical protein